MGGSLNKLRKWWNINLNSNPAMTEPEPPCNLRLLLHMNRSRSNQNMVLALLFNLRTTSKPPTWTNLKAQRLTGSDSIICATVSNYDTWIFVDFIIYYNYLTLIKLCFRSFDLPKICCFYSCCDYTFYFIILFCATIIERAEPLYWLKINFCFQ